MFLCTNVISQTLAHIGDDSESRSRIKDSVGDSDRALSCTKTYKPERQEKAALKGRDFSDPLIINNY
ncbi:hypothetical protein IQ270_19085 [Microcoleus sp. LEGE 07076]|uniref:hypothetical protein n=1 Tax=Microcoleus sp. LEGE 07076 TaxID=915322 RepID=UPI001880E2FB|nr:hypothetical protein [Microcoleus sp. LEGE 07076]MBE9186731.1 hypothetical protein [Microcoleus sp. LEGE 07076]